MSSTTPENMHAIGARDTFKHQNYCCNMEREHNFECSMCNDAFPSEDQLTAHQVVKHGKPITEADEW